MTTANSEEQRRNPLNAARMAGRPSLILVNDDARTSTRASGYGITRIEDRSPVAPRLTSDTRDLKAQSPEAAGEMVSEGYAFTADF